MKLQVEKAKIMQTLKVVKEVCVKKGLNPILATLKLTTVKAGLQISATNLNENIISVEEANIEEEGNICVNAEKLYSIISCLDNIINMETRGHFLSITSGNSKFELVTISGDEFPSITENVPDNGKEISFNPKELKECLKKVIFASSIGSIGVLSGVCFTIKGNTLELASTDGARLSLVKLNISQTDEDKQIICPINILDFLSKNNFETVKMYYDDKKIYFIADNFLYSSNTIEGVFPKYETLIPNTFEKNIIINKKSLIEGVEKVSIMANEKTNIVKLDFKNNNLLLSTESLDAGSAEENIELEYTDTPFVIAFNFAFLLDCLRAFSDEEIEFSFNKSTSPAILKGDYLHLIMPINLK